MTIKKIAVIGAGPMGLMCTYELLKQGYSVSLFERDDRIGGMSASFDLDGTKIERFYHFICKTDYPLFNLLKELGIYDKLLWKETKMGFYYNGNLYQWGDPLSLLKFPKLSFLAKVRYGLHVLYSKNIKKWDALDKENAVTWLKKWIGIKGYEILWESLFRLKFYEHQHDLSAAWIAARIQRMAKSRHSLLKESLGYLEGGSDLLLSLLEKKIVALHGKIQLKADVNQIISENKQVQGLRIDNEIIPFDAVISTIPMPYVSSLVPTLPEELRQQIISIENVGVVCVVMKLHQPFSQYFWTNINDPTIAIPGVIEYSNLNPSAGNVLYTPFYMPNSHPKHQQSDEEFIKEVSDYLKKINPEFSLEWVKAAKVARYRYAQTVCTPHFYSKLPNMQTPIKNFYMADTAFYYPEDRCISESVNVGKKLAQLVVNSTDLKIYD